MDEARFLALALTNPINVAIIDELANLALPDAWLVSGSLVQSAWNVITGRAIDHGIADYDVFYFDPNTSWEAEDAVIRNVHARLGHLGVKIETRNQARVHLWYPDKHGLPYPPLTCSTAPSTSSTRSIVERRERRMSTLASIAASPSGRPALSRVSTTASACSRGGKAVLSK